MSRTRKDIRDHYAVVLSDGKAGEVVQYPGNEVIDEIERLDAALAASQRHAELLATAIQEFLAAEPVNREEYYVELENIISKWERGVGSFEEVV